jgi:hypothetical protein
VEHDIGLAVSVMNHPTTSFFTIMFEKRNPGGVRRMEG